MSIKTIIVDDERLAREGLKNLLKDFPEINIIGEAGNADEASELVDRLKPQLLFLDVEMPGKNGFALLEDLIDTPCVIFTTAYNEFAIKAFEVNALDYLLKPIQTERLRQGIARVKKEIADISADSQKNQLGDKDQVFIRDGEKCWFVKMEDIRMIESAGNYAKIYFDEYHPLIHKTLHALDERLSPSMFFRANRQQIINLRYIDKIEPFFNAGFIIIMKDGTKVEVSRRQSVKFKEMMSL
ncbi:MAG: LytTR family transcriptional regulator DNA-binding domain-containing protein [Sphingobacteriales bacterium]|jgi:two-component system LytT family response regulator|nr:LytTR family transcriptional regulator DNA-binding domain-containing protein [Sphingobacteriales bacterium]